MNNFDFLKHGYQALNKYMSDNDCTTQILDPLSVMLRLSLLTFKPSGTKISIHEHAIRYNVPGPLQGTTRWFRGDKRSDLHNLRNPIQKATEWFDTNENEYLKQIFVFSKHGLKQLSQVYSSEESNTSAMVCHCINHYIQLVDRTLNQKLVTESYVQAKNKSREEDGYKKLRNTWNEKEMKIVADLLQLAVTQREKNEEYEGYVRSIETLLDEKDKLTAKIINNFIKTLQ